jgi:SAM-dependent methyltransferase
VKALAEIGLDIGGQHSKSVNEIPLDDVDAVVTLCAEEVCPVFLGKALRVHWGLPDPAAVCGDEQLEAFRRVRDELRRRLAVVFGQPEKSVLDAQARHWDGTLQGKPDMFGTGPSEPARYAAELFARAGVRNVLELGGGQGRDSLFLAGAGFQVSVLDYAGPGVEIIRERAQAAGLADHLRVAQHDVRERFPFADACFDACYSHMLFCMALTEAELRRLSDEVLRVLRPGGLNVFTVRNTNDPDFGRGLHRGEDLYENQGFVVQFFDRAKVERVTSGFTTVGVEELEEGKVPRRLFRVTLRKPA